MRPGGAAAAYSGLMRYLLYIRHSQTKSHNLSSHGIRTEPTDSAPVTLPVPAQLAESEISDLLLEDVPPHSLSQGDEILDDDEADSPFYTYETRELAILALYLDQVSRKTKAEKAMLLDLLVQYNRNFLGQDVSVPMTTSGNAHLR